MSEFPLKFALVSYGSRGDVESCAAVGRELLRRGHEVRIAVPPNLVGLVESAGLPAVDYGLDSKRDLDPYRNFWISIFRNFWKLREVTRLWREATEVVARCEQEATTTLVSLAHGADLLFTGLAFEQQAANVAEFYDIPLATLHFFPVRPNGRAVPFLPSPLTRTAMALFDWLAWRAAKRSEDALRRELGLPKSTGPLSGRITQRGWLEIQSYDDFWFPGLAAEWTRLKNQRPFVGALALELPTDVDNEVASWIASGPPPIYFGFGSIPVGSPAETLAMIGDACAQLGERALICAGWSDFSELFPQFDHVKIVREVNHAAIFPTCRAVVHHGGAGTTAAGVRAGVPTLILWTLPDQPVWGHKVKRLEIGFSRRLSSTTLESLVTDLRRILEPHYATRAREFATRMTKSAVSCASTADLIEEMARISRIG
jgi:UDP:flavonoid glycosyltransferase YjiC (YdhE family)